MAYYSHHKCATMYVVSILHRLCAECGLVFRSFDDADGFGGDLADHVATHGIDVVAYINARREDVEPLGPVPAFHVVRDPRDILVSAYFSHLHSHETGAWPELVEHRRRLGEVDKEEGLLLELDFIANVFEAIRDWDYDTGHILELSFRQLTGDPYASFLRIFEHLGMLREADFGLRAEAVYVARGLWNQAAARVAADSRLRRTCRRVPAQRLLGIVHDHRFSRKAGGRHRGEEDRSSHYRKGQPGDWKNHLTPVHLDAFREKFPGLLEMDRFATGSD